MVLIRAYLVVSSHDWLFNVCGICIVIRFAIFAAYLLGVLVPVMITDLHILRMSRFVFCLCCAYAVSRLWLFMWFACESACLIYLGLSRLSKAGRMVRGRWVTREEEFPRRVLVWPVDWIACVYQLFKHGWCGQDDRVSVHVVRFWCWLSY